MKCIVVACMIFGVLAELPRYRPARFRVQRQELEPTTTESPTEATTEQTGPYPASGWRPAGQAFTLPTDTTPDPTYGPPEANGPYPASGWKPEGQAFSLPTETTPAPTYGPPSEANGPYPPYGWKPEGTGRNPPETSYGVPESTYGIPDSTYGVLSTDATTTDNPAAERLEGPVDVQKSVGTYYVLLPNGQLQRVEFVTENDIQNMKYTARLQLRNRAPLYVFGP